MLPRRGLRRGRLGGHALGLLRDGGARGREGLPPRRFPGGRAAGLCIGFSAMKQIFERNGSSFFEFRKHEILI